MVSHVLAKDASIIVSVIVADWNGYSCNEAFTLSKQFTRKKKQEKDERDCFESYNEAIVFLFTWQTETTPLFDEDFVC